MIRAIIYLTAIFLGPAILITSCADESFAQTWPRKILVTQGAKLTLENNSGVVHVIPENHGELDICVILYEPTDPDGYWKVVDDFSWGDWWDTDCEGLGHEEWRMWR